MRNARQRKRLEGRRAKGLPTSIPIDIVRKRITELNNLGLTNVMIGQAAGLGRYTTTHIMVRNTQFVTLEVATAIFGVDHRPHPNQLTVLAIGALRRVRALNAIGWPTDEIATRLGYTSRAAVNLAITKRTMTYALWARIRDVYDELSGTPGPSPRSAARARTAKWAPPLAWAGLDIDNPRAQPDWVAFGVSRNERPLCSQGHEYTPANTLIDNLGARVCRACQRAATARRRAAQPPLVADSAS